jgi:hemerythrin-like domain-containing protein
MCEYCGCQDIAAIAQLTAEHDRALDYVRDAERAAGAQDMTATRIAAMALVELLAPHIAVEEEALFPAMANEYPDHIRILVGEHDLIEQALAEVSSPGEPESDWPGRVLRAMQLLRTHISKEQDGVFPAALAILGPDDWDRLDQVRKRFNPDPSDPPEQTETVRG